MLYSESLKDSGTEWIGMIPENWHTSKIESLYSLRNEKVSDKDYPPLSVTMQGILPQLDTAAKTNDGDNRKLVRVGDFAINSRSDRRGSCGISPLDGSVSLINTILTPRSSMNSGYYNWLFHTSQFADEFYKWGHGIVADLWTTRWQEMKHIIVPVPSLPDQNNISSYLDSVCADIDTAISEAKASIEDYKLLKQSIITQAVTKGLEPSVPMKDSGVEWIGKMPKGWTISKIKYISELAPNLTISFDRESPVGYVPMDCVKNGYMTPSKAQYEKLSTGLVSFQNNDIVMAKVTPCFENGNIAIASDLAQQVAFGSSELFVFRCKRVDREYLFYYLQMQNLKSICISTMTGTGGLKRVSPYFLKNAYITVPSRKEQKQIASNLNARCKQIETIITEKQSTINDLESYKESLIYEVVTGKRKVV